MIVLSISNLSFQSLVFSRRTLALNKHPVLLLNELRWRSHVRMEGRFDQEQSR